MRRILILCLSLTLLLAALPLCASGEAEVSLPDFALEDQYGKVWTPADLAGKTVFLNLWTTWCPWCIEEMPDIEALYHEYGDNAGDVLILGVGSPSLYDDADVAGITAFLAENGFTYPVLMDSELLLCSAFGVEAFPTTWIIAPDGTLNQTLVGALEKADMQKVIRITQAIYPQ